MAVDYIDVTSTERHGAALRQAVSYQLESLERLRSLVAVMDEMVDGGDYSQVETSFGLDAGEGTLVYNLVVGTKAAIDVSAVTQLLARIG